MSCGIHYYDKLLLDHTNHPNIHEQNRYTPLHAAAENGAEEMIRALLYGGADLLLTNIDGKTALDLAMAAGHEKATILLGEGVTKRFPQKRD